MESAALRPARSPATPTQVALVGGLLVLAAAFATGYLLVWMAAGLVAYALAAFVRDRDVSFLAWHHGGRFLAAGVILAAAAYQFTRAKSRCLTHCRAVRVGPGRARAAAWTGVRHGGWCLGCCATLMAALFALGLMSLTWMAVVAVLISAERLLPWPRATVYAVAAVLIVLGMWMALAPGDLPGLTLPGAMSAM